MSESTAGTTGPGGVMSDPGQAHEPTAAGGCCATAPVAVAAPSEAAAQPCCGTARAATDAQACCDPAAKKAAVGAGAGCCG